MGVVVASIAGCSGSSTQPQASGASRQAFCEAVTNVELTSAGYTGLAAVTPAERRDDVERFAAFLADLEAAEGADAAERRQAIMSDPQYEETLQRIGNYVTEECGIGGDGEPAVEGEPSASTTQAAPSDVTSTTSSAAAPSDKEPTPGTDDAGSRREEAAVPPNEVKAEMREIFGDRLWGSSHGYFAPDGSEYEGNVSELTEAEALSACEELSAFIAGHSDMEGQGVLRLTDITVNSDDEVVTNPIAVNETIAVGDQGSCRAAG